MEKPKKKHHESKARRLFKTLAILAVAYFGYTYIFGNVNASPTEVSHTLINIPLITQVNFISINSTIRNPINQEIIVDSENLAIGMNFGFVTAVQHPSEPCGDNDVVVDTIKVNQRKDLCQKIKSMGLTFGKVLTQKEINAIADDIVILPDDDMDRLCSAAMDACYYDDYHLIFTHINPKEDALVHESGHEHVPVDNYRDPILDVCFLSNGDHEITIVSPDRTSPTGYTKTYLSPEEIPSILEQIYSVLDGTSNWDNIEFPRYVQFSAGNNNVNYRITQDDFHRLAGIYSYNRQTIDTSFIPTNKPYPMKKIADLLLRVTGGLDNLLKLTNDFSAHVRDVGVALNTSLEVKDPEESPIDSTKACQ